jgi:hypothetical protein
VIKYDAPASRIVSDVIEQAIKIAQVARDRVQLTFNGDAVVVCATHGEQVYN